MVKEGPFGGQRSVSFFAKGGEAPPSTWVSAHSRTIVLHEVPASMQPLPRLRAELRLCIAIPAYL